MGHLSVTNHFPRKGHYVDSGDFKRLGDESHLKESPDDLYFQVHRTVDMSQIYGPKLPPIKYPYYFAGILKKGRFRVSVGLTAFETTPYMIWFAAPNQIYSCEDLGADSEAHYMNFSTGYLLAGYANKMLLHDLPFYSLSYCPYLTLDKENGEYLYSLFEKVHAEYNSNKKNKDDLIRLNTLLMLLLSERLYDANRAMTTVNSITSNLVYRFKVLIEENFKKHLLPSAYADILAVHPNYLNRATKSQTGKTSSELINERTKLEAVFHAGLFAALHRGNSISFRV